MIGQTLSHYQVLEKLGAAGWARYLVHTIRVWIVVLPSSSCRPISPLAGARERLRREARGRGGATGSPLHLQVFEVGRR